MSAFNDTEYPNKTLRYYKPIEKSENAKVRQVSLQPTGRRFTTENGDTFDTYWYQDKDTKEYHMAVKNNGRWQGVTTDNQGNYYFTGDILFNNLAKTQQLPEVIITANEKKQQGGRFWYKSDFERYFETLPFNQRDTTNYRVEDYWRYHGSPKDFNEAVKRGMFHLENGVWHAYSVAENPETGDIEFMKAYNHPTIQKELD